MAQIDPSIALGFKLPQIQDPVAAAARAQEFGVNALKMGEMQRGIEVQNKLRGAFAEDVDLSTPEGFKRIAAIDPSTALKLRSEALQGRKLEGDIKKTGLDITQKQLEQSRERTSDLAFNPSDSNIKAYLEDSIIRKEITPTQAQGLFAQVANMPLDKRRDTFLQMGANAGKRIDQMTISAAQQQTADISKRGQDISASTALRGQDITLQGQRMQYDPMLQSNIAEAKAAGDFMGKNKATAAAALPSALEAAREGIRLIDEMVGQAEVRDKSGKVITKGTAPHPGFTGYVGAGMPGMRFVEGSDTASFEVRQKQIEGKAFLEAFQTLKGGGAITEKEGEKGTAAIMRMNKASNEKEYIAAARELQGILRTGMDRSRAKAGNPAPSDGGGVIDFNTLK